MVATTRLFNGTGRSYQELSLRKMIFIKLGMGFPSRGVQHKWRGDLGTGRTFPEVYFCCFAYGSIFQRMGCVLGRKSKAGKAAGERL